MTITIHAIYRDGVLTPEEKLDLPDNTPVQLQVTALPTTPVQGNSLFGAFPELAALTDNDFAGVKRLRQG